MDTNNLIRLASGFSVFGRSELGPYAAGKVCCQIHRSVEQVSCGEFTGVVPVAGTHPAFGDKSSKLVSECYAGPKVLSSDRRFLLNAVLLAEVSPQYRFDRVLSGLRRWETGTVAGLSAFGSGYCYLKLVREKFRFRVARILGPVPLVSDVCLMLRVSGLSSARFALQSVAQGYFHLADDGPFVDGQQYMDELIGIVEMDPSARLGVGSDRFALQPLKPVEPKVYCDACCCYVVDEGHASVCNSLGIGLSSHKVVCDVCGFLVVAEGHELRCRLPGVSEKGGPRALLGDAWHAVDVKTMVVASFGREQLYSKAVQEFVKASAQRAYLQMIGVGAVSTGTSDHSWGTEFEIRYIGEFRVAYLEWLCSVLKSRCSPVRVASVVEASARLKRLKYVHFNFQ